MPQPEHPDKEPVSALSTLALLKTNFDAGHDHIEMFLPFVLDAIGNFSEESFKVTDLAEALTSRLRLQVPHDAVKTLLARAIKRGFLRRDYGRYWPVQGKTPKTNLLKQLNALKAVHLYLGQQFCDFASERNVSLTDPEEALAMILDFLERNHVSMLLEDPTPVQSDNSVFTTPSKNSRLVARFVQERITADPTLTNILQQVIQGLVLQKTLLLRDIAQVRRKFRDFRVFLDTRILLQALGYQGESARVAAKEMIEMLRHNEATVEVFRDTVDEIKNMFDVYVNRIGTAQDRESLYPNALTHFFLTNRYSPSDIVTAIATLEIYIGKLRITIRDRPKRQVRYTLNEDDLSHRLAKHGSPKFEPRVWHDVNCVAAVLTLRKGLMTDNLDAARVVFVTTTGLVVKNVKEWWIEQIEGEKLKTSSLRIIPPAIHQIALSNHAWLKNPASATSLKLHELTALCYVALQPSKTAWEQFIGHLRKLKESGIVTSQEVALVMASHLTEVSLAEAEEDGELDAETLDEVVNRVKSSYASLADAAAEKAKQADQAHKNLETHISERADMLASRITRVGFAGWAIAIAILIYLSVTQPNWIFGLLLGVLTFLNLVFGTYVYRSKVQFQVRLADWLRNWLVGG